MKAAAGVYTAPPARDIQTPNMVNFLSFSRQQHPSNVLLLLDMSRTQILKTIMDFHYFCFARVVHVKTRLIYVFCMINRPPHAAFHNPGVSFRRPVMFSMYCLGNLLNVHNMLAQMSQIWPQASI